ncbi:MULTISPECIES: DUF86 domain-containing protein [unclassified Roseofilum]|uniref:HepT-like ribonuclease domain-containing protein n=1 Tax=unclassified Roseofilum TaxID=2620099 RepID=UPI00298E9337|nr:MULTISPECIES: DUF86 domain-containing protein [unclassified Roseofilum]
MNRTIKDYLRDILEAINAAEIFVIGFDFDTFESDQKTIFAVTHAVEIIGKASKQIPPEFKEQYPHIPWKEVAGMRDKMIHHYFLGDFPNNININLSIIMD